ncbi:heavy-metal-associated domain-containing protein [Streptomyces sp. NPDC052535]|uniref:heavy-metal-associated domain-containing protein n=1 Tax=Streptomyces sp. NPDC052535 TaxID=3155531 RepID=UPI00341BCA2F
MPKALVRSVPAIRCGDCRQVIEGAVGALPGVAVAEVDAGSRSVAVLYEAPAEPAGIDAAIRHAGHRIAQQAGRTTS